jgi:hypothetical protein
MVSKLKQYSPLIIAAAILWLILILYLNASLSLTEGNVIYALDDAYIHAAMAKNLSQHGVWGVTGHQFSSTSSSLLWTLLLSLFFLIFGVNESIPLLMNFFTATLLLVLLFYIFRQSKFNALYQALILLAFIFFIPVPYLVFGGLEHVLQILINLFYIYIAARVINGSTPVKGKSIKTGRNLLFFLAPLVVLVRYEGLFILFAVSLLLLARKKYVTFLINALTGLLPVVVYGVISMINGWYFLPNSVLLKGTRPDISSIGKILEFIYAGLRHVVYNVHLLVLLLSVMAFLWFLYKKYHRLWLLPNTMGMVFILVLGCQMFFSESGYYLNRYPWIRYDAYLVALGMLTVFIAVGYPLLPSSSREEEKKPGKTKTGRLETFMIVCLVFALVLPLAERGVRTDLKVVRAAANIYGQQYQMGLFLKKYYPGQPVVVNDIGAACFHGDIQCIDVWGLASKEIGDLQLNDAFTPGNILRITKQSGARLAVVYDQFFRLVGIESDLPKDWIKVARWRIPRNVVCVRDTVSFFVFDESEKSRLIRNLREFAAQLPPEVLKTGVFIKGL